MPEPQSVSPWPEPPEDAVLFLLDAAHGVERNLLEEWCRSTREVAGSATTEVSQATLSILFGKKGRVDTGDLPGFLDGPDSLRVVPLRVVWLPPESRRRPGPRLRDLLAGDPRHPRRWVANAILKLDPDRARCIKGASATLGELRAAYGELQDDGDAAEANGDFAAFVVRRAGVALDVAERRVRGNRYKVPHYVAHGVRSNPAFKRALKDLAKDLGKESSFD